MKTMTKKNNRSTRRCNTKRRRSRAKGGMHRRFASHTAKTVLGKVFGETWPDRFSKGKDMIDAGLKGAADAAKKKKHHTPASSAARNSFASNSPHFRISRIDAITLPRVDENYNTPKKTQTDADSEILLPVRLKHVENDHQRAQRLGLSVAPTVQNPNTIVTKLFHDDPI